MRLLHTSTLKLEDFIGVRYRPPYAILSHTWGDDEFLFEEAQNRIPQDLGNPKRGLRKVLDACKRARGDGLDYIWIDTCCIDKSSSAELSEAINSMFKWYMESTNCYVFMEDVTFEMDGTMRNFVTSRWFTRGWTLQELIAPHGLLFFDRDWKYMCSRDEIAPTLEKITHITPSILERSHISPVSDLGRVFRCVGCGHVDAVKEMLRTESISNKMRWAANRVTTRPEDASYSLLGLFDINMPLLYGEGENAFWRLQEEILHKYPDQSILTWTDRSKGDTSRPYFTKTPASFLFRVSQSVNGMIERGGIIATSRGLEIDVMVGPCAFCRKKLQPAILTEKLFMAVLNCAVEKSPLTRVAIFVRPLTPGAPDTAYIRVYNDRLIQLQPGAPPLVLEGGLEETIRELNDMTVEYNPQRLSQRRILLAPVNAADHYIKTQPIVQLNAPGIEKVTGHSKHLQMRDEPMIPYKRSSFGSGDKGFSTLNLSLAIYLGNGNSGFFVLYGVPSLSEDGDLMAWVETWRSFFQEDPSSDNLRDLQWNTFDKGLRKYLSNHARESTVFATEISEPDFKAKVGTKTFEFLVT
ncbi:hypothetical protein CEP54_016025 [Fusarium duplospermum]|uniref:Uncharacterized protein n=1 Tax=Fusarium duplospermum TaxID=1325734 RepID=A0A428NJ08_9HYPO|nr:hypothetical protein CEP54_016025 [Fusarium duplospermum]